MTFYDNFTKIQEYVNNELKEEVIKILEIIIEEYILTQMRKYKEQKDVNILLEIKNQWLLFRSLWFR